MFKDKEYLKVYTDSNYLKQGKFKEFVTILLENYYDPKYLHGMRNYQFDLELDAEDLNKAMLNIIKFRNDQ